MGNLRTRSKPLPVGIRYESSCEESKKKISFLDSYSAHPSVLSTACQHSRHRSSCLNSSPSCPLASTVYCTYILRLKKSPSPPFCTSLRREPIGRARNLLGS